MANYSYRLFTRGNPYDKRNYLDQRPNATYPLVEVDDYRLSTESTEACSGPVLLSQSSLADKQTTECFPVQRNTSKLHFKSRTLRSRSNISPESKENVDILSPQPTTTLTGSRSSGSWTFGRLTLISEFGSPKISSDPSPSSTTRNCSMAIVTGARSENSCKINQAPATHILYQPSVTKPSRFSRTLKIKNYSLLPTVTLTPPDDEADYFTESPFPITLYSPYDAITARDYGRLRVPMAPLGALSAAERKRWPHPAGPWLRSTINPETPLLPGIRFRNGVVLGSARIRRRVISGSNVNQNAFVNFRPRPFPPLRIPNEKDRTRRTQSGTRMNRKAFQLIELVTSR
ncbi:hypothetical protein CROQUDRAFT_672902 [Cronartium quercuum f. sp. fusiforme G11]|uniref:Uncharacterized protein n=1 Tax=Cronartium quercuum f. sp. fusiforme G11 TaxID=708437 RepID=A0A9P6NDB4_9BASI|nr:hypothetical protein CROQUDRAFT_672902 [Cronartium quercuum f. sp. fusiforme G11]